MISLTQNLKNISFRAWSIWYRNLEVLKEGWIFKLAPPILEPIIYVFGFGFGLGSLVGVVTYQNDKIPYLQFMVPGVLSITVMFWAFFETTYSTYVRMEFQKTFDSILATPLLLEDIIVGEWLWAATKALIATTLMLATVSLLGLISWPEAFLMFPVIIIGGLLFSALGLITTAICKSIDMFNVPIFAIIMPMFMFSGTFFPLDVLPGWAKTLAQFLPLTHLSLLIRGAALGKIPDSWVWNVTYLIFSTAIISLLSLRLMYKRMVK